MIKYKWKQPFQTYPCHSMEELQICSITSPRSDLGKPEFLYGGPCRGPPPVLPILGAEGRQPSQQSRRLGEVAQ